ncbi:MAG: T9SS type A sorting domain-containing protein [Ignavibacteria bacterium]|nr:T9SS type A sorting domain-containing protein [Ignavibacteria bacterium]
MKSLLKLFLLAILILNLNSSVFSNSRFSAYNSGKVQKEVMLVNPLYDLSARYTEATDMPARSNFMFIDLIIYHTNLTESGPFQYAAGQYVLYFNYDIGCGGQLKYEIIPGSSQFSNPNAIPVNPRVSGNRLLLDRNPNLLPGDGPIVSPTFPGTTILKMKFSTSAPSFCDVPLNLSWVNALGNSDSTAVFAFIGDSTNNISDGGTFGIDSGDVVLPVELSNFSAEKYNNNVKLNWSTVTESNNSGFEIERLSGNYNWERIGYVNGNGTTSTPYNYSYNDNNLISGIYNYRLKQIDFNGNFEYFNLRNEVILESPVSFNLKQNYPNPFNPVTKIDFDIPNDGFVSIKLFDVGGREIKSIVNEFKNAGYYSVQLDASSLPSGVYFYRLESGNFTSTKKITLLK